jgi:uncharacterized protein YjlB
MHLGQLIKILMEIKRQEGPLLHPEFQLLDLAKDLWKEEISQFRQIMKNKMWLVTWRNQLKRLWYHTHNLKMELKEVVTWLLK